MLPESMNVSSCGDNFPSQNIYCTPRAAQIQQIPAFNVTAQQQQSLLAQDTDGSCIFGSPCGSTGSCLSDTFLGYEAVCEDFEKQQLGTAAVYETYPVLSGLQATAAQFSTLPDPAMLEPHLGLSGSDFSLALIRNAQGVSSIGHSDIFSAAPTITTTANFKSLSVPSIPEGLHDCFHPHMSLAPTSEQSRVRSISQGNIRVSRGGSPSLIPSPQQLCANSLTVANSHSLPAAAFLDQLANDLMPMAPVNSFLQPMDDLVGPVSDLLPTGPNLPVSLGSAVPSSAVFSDVVEQKPVTGPAVATGRKILDLTQMPPAKAAQITRRRARNRAAASRCRVKAKEKSVHLNGDLQRMEDEIAKLQGQVIRLSEENGSLKKQLSKDGDGELEASLSGESMPSSPASASAADAGSEQQ